MSTRAFRIRAPLASSRERFGLIACACVLLVATACGKVGPPLPPLPRAVARPGATTASQVGDRVTIAWQAPNLDLRESESSSVSRAEVYRLIQPRDVPQVAFVDQFVESGAELVGFLDYEILKKQLTEHADRVLLYEDRLDLSERAALSNRRFVYAVRYVDQQGRPLSWSSLVAVEPVPGIAMPPTGLEAAERQDEVMITWTPPSRNIDGTEPAQVLGYNIYRTGPNAERLGAPLNKRLLTEPRYVDQGFQYLKPYVYVVRSVSQGPDAQVESVNSGPLAVTPRDVFPPAAPTNVTAASAGGVVSLFWPANAERDVRGYYVYRTDGEASNASRWVRITENPVTRTTYRDERTRTGQRYGYRITAVDRFGNESPPSAFVSETAWP